VKFVTLPLFGANMSLELFSDGIFITDLCGITTVLVRKIIQLSWSIEIFLLSVFGL
jgi:hypothetical protein